MLSSSARDLPTPDTISTVASSVPAVGCCRSGSCRLALSTLGPAGRCILSRGRGLNTSRRAWSPRIALFPVSGARSNGSTRKTRRPSHQTSSNTSTQIEDKLVALQGIARKCQELTGDILTDGVWRNASGFCLLWLSREEPLERNTSTQIPSWSWASAEGKIQFPHGAAVLDIRNVAPEIDLAGIETAPTQKSVLWLDNAVFINTHLHFMQGRVGTPKWDDMRRFVNLEHATRYWDVYEDDGRYLGWASLDRETRQTVDGLTAGISCIKIASNQNDQIETGDDGDGGRDRGFLVLFIAFSSQLGAWQRVGMEQILDRRRFQSEAVGMKLV